MNTLSPEFSVPVAYKTPLSLDSRVMCARKSQDLPPIDALAAVGMRVIGGK
jgi:hypothetical protein